VQAKARYLDDLVNGSLPFSHSVVFKSLFECIENGVTIKPFNGNHEGEAELILVSLIHPLEALKLGSGALV
jgi:hypothetical protein